MVVHDRLRRIHIVHPYIYPARTWTGDVIVAGIIGTVYAVIFAFIYRKAEHVPLGGGKTGYASV